MIENNSCHMHIHTPCTDPQNKKGIYCPFRTAQPYNKDDEDCVFYGQLSCQMLKPRIQAVRNYIENRKSENAYCEVAEHTSCSETSLRFNSCKYSKVSRHKKLPCDFTTMIQGACTNKEALEEKHIVLKSEYKARLDKLDKANELLSSLTLDASVDIYSSSPNVLTTAYNVCEFLIWVEYMRLEEASAESNAVKLTFKWSDAEFPLFVYVFEIPDKDFGFKLVVYNTTVKKETYRSVVGTIGGIGTDIGTVRRRMQGEVYLWKEIHDAEY